MEANLYFAADKEEMAASFQEKYKGYYPECEFTCIIASKNGFIAAAQGTDGYPYAYRSIMGNVWEPVSLTGKSPDGTYKRAESRIVALLWHDRKKQVYFICENGELLTLPDCPDCAKIQKISHEKISGARWKDEKKNYIILVNALGKERMVDTDQMSQFQITLSYAKQNGGSGCWVWLGGEDNRLRAEGCNGTLFHMKFEQLSEWLSGVSKDTWICFACENGTKSELAAYIARKKGYVNSYFVRI